MYPFLLFAKSTPAVRILCLVSAIFILFPNRGAAQTWATQTSTTAENLRGVWSNDASNVWAVGNNGTIVKYDGVNWAGQTSPTMQQLKPMVHSALKLLR